MLDRDKECTFCDIVWKDSPARIVCESDECLAFFPFSPATRGHTLVVPRKHVQDIWALDVELGIQVLDTTLLVSRALRASLKPDGLNIINSAGEAASQTVRHLHIHLVPRWHNDRMGKIWPAKEVWSAETLDDLATNIRAACTGLSL
jgi:histidine triad (HIT) family protein